MSQGDPTDELLARLYLHAERTARRIAGPALAEDLASETIIRALTRWPRIRDYPEAWVTRVAANLAIDELRKRRPVRADTAEPTAPADTEAINKVILDGHLRSLSHRQRQVVVLHYLLEFTDAEVAQTLQLSVPTVKTHLARALATLRRRHGTAQENTDVSPDPA